MTPEERARILPGFLHDAVLLSLAIDFEQDKATLKVDVDLSDPADSTVGGFAEAILAFPGLSFCLLAPPERDPLYFFGTPYIVHNLIEPGSTPMDGTPVVPQGSFGHYICCDLPSRYLYLAASDAIMKWAGLPRKCLTGYARAEVTEPTPNLRNTALAGLPLVQSLVAPALSSLVSLKVDFDKLELRMGLGSINGSMTTGIHEILFHGLGFCVIAAQDPRHCCLPLGSLPVSAQGTLEIWRGREPKLPPVPEGSFGYWLQAGTPGITIFVAAREASLASTFKTHRATTPPAC